MTWALQLALLGVVDRRGDRRERGADALQSVAGLDEGVVDVVGVRHGQPLPGVRSDGLPQQLGQLDDTGDQRRILDDPPQHPGQPHEPPGRQLHADRVAHHVLEDVGLVEHHDVVLREDHAAAADVQPVQVGVDDDDVGGARPPPGLLGEARLAERAAVGARALVAADAHRPPRRVGRRPVELGGVARIGADRPTRRCGRSRRASSPPCPPARAAPPRRRTPRRRRARAGAAGTRSCCVPSARPSRTRAAGPRPGTAGPWWPAGPAGPSWR